MDTQRTISKTHERDPFFSERVQQLVSTTPMSIYELQNIYLETFNRNDSPMIHCTATQKAIVLTTIPGVRVKSRIDDHPILGRAIVLMVSKK